MLMQSRQENSIYCVRFPKPANRSFVRPCTYTCPVHHADFGSVDFGNVETARRHQLEREVQLFGHHLQDRHFAAARRPRPLYVGVDSDERNLQTSSRQRSGRLRASAAWMHLWIHSPDYRTDGDRVSRNPWSAVARREMMGPTDDHIEVDALVQCRP